MKITPAQSLSPPPLLLSCKKNCFVWLSDSEAFYSSDDQKVSRCDHDDSKTDRATYIFCVTLYHKSKNCLDFEPSSVKIIQERAF